MADKRPPDPAVGERAAGDRLETWGEIAAYLGREIRTVQRWEKAMALPVRRLGAGPDKQPRVFALKSELDAWWRDHEVLRNAPDPADETSSSSGGIGFLLRRGRREFRRALDLRPTYATAHQFYAYYLTAMGRLPEAIAERKKAVDLDALSPLMASALGEAYYQARQFDQTIEQNQRALELDPGYAIALVNIGRAYEQKGMHAQAQAAFQKILAFAPDDPAVLALIGHDYALSGQRAEAAQVITRLKNLSTRRYVPSLYEALIYTGLGDKNEAFRFMEAAFSERTEYLVYLGAEPLADPLRDDPRLSDLMKRVGVPARSSGSH